MKNICKLLCCLLLLSSINTYAGDEPAKELRVAIEENNVISLKNHLKHVDVNKRYGQWGESGYTLIHYAAKYDHPRVIHALADAKADINATVLLPGLTALHLAVIYIKSDTVKALLECGANRKQQNTDHQTPADLARANGHHGIAQLIDNYDDGVDIKQPDQELK